MALSHVAGDSQRVLPCEGELLSCPLPMSSLPLRRFQAWMLPLLSELSPSLFHSKPLFFDSKMHMVEGSASDVAPGRSLYLIFKGHREPAKISV